MFPFQPENIEKGSIICPHCRGFGMLKRSICIFVQALMTARIKKKLGFDNQYLLTLKLPN